MPPNMNEGECWHAAHTYTVQHIRQITMTFITVISMLLALLNTNIPEPYHMSILSGQGWVNELLEGHPECICCELGVSQEVFLQLITSLHGFGFGDLKYVQLEEQLAIFLYMSITGLTIWHTGECFQYSNKTIFKYFCWILRIFSSEPFNTAYVHQPSWHGCPTIMTDSPQPQNVVILWACSRCSRWYSYLMFTSIVQPITRSQSVEWLRMMMMMQSVLMEGWVNKMQGGTVLPMWCGSSTEVNMLTRGFLPLV